MTVLAPLAAITLSIALIVALWHTDPKRRRTSGLEARPLSPAARRGLVAALLLPGVVLAALGDSAAFLIWLGGCAVGGWLIAHLRPAPDQADRAPAKTKG